MGEDDRLKPLKDLAGLPEETVESALLKALREERVLTEIIISLNKKLLTVERMYKDVVEALSNGSDNLGDAINVLLKLMLRDPGIMASKEWMEAPSQIVAAATAAYELKKELDDENVPPSAKKDYVQ